MSDRVAHAGQTVETTRRVLTTRFKKINIESPELDARLLAGTVLSLDLTGLITQAARHLTADEAALADVAGILWLVNESPAGRRLAAAEAPHAAGDNTLDIRREIAFAWVSPAPLETSPGDTADPADWPTIRGVIDVLLVNRRTREAEILDYKTDALFTWEKNAAGYAEQRRYYLAPASDILGFAVSKATLLFLTPRREQTVSPGPITSGP